MVSLCDSNVVWVVRDSVAYQRGIIHATQEVRVGGVVRTKGIKPVVSET